MSAGILGLSRVIERHQIDSTALDIANAEAVVRSEPVGGRDILSLKGPSLIAASKEVPAASRTALNGPSRPYGLMRSFRSKSGRLGQASRRSRNVIGPAACGGHRLANQSGDQREYSNERAYPKWLCQSQN